LARNSSMILAFQSCASLTPASCSPVVVINGPLLRG